MAVDVLSIEYLKCEVNEVLPFVNALAHVGCKPFGPTAWVAGDTLGEAAAVIAR